MGGRVLVTRPEPGLSETMVALATRGLTPLAAPMLAIEHLSLGRVPDAAALVVSSGQAVPALAEALAAQRLRSDLAIFAVGDRTAQRLSEAGFVNVLSAAGDASHLVEQIVNEARPHARLVLTTGQGEGTALVANLREHGFVVTRRVVYRAQAVRALDPAILDAWMLEPEGALFFSAATARAFSHALPARYRAYLRDITAYALSEQVANGLEGLQWGAIRIAPRPNAASLLACLDQG